MTVRVNIEDDLEDSGRLAKFCQLMRWNLDRGMGRLVRVVYRATQHAEIVTAPRSKIVEVTIIKSLNEAEANRVIDAMIGAQLADIMPDGNIYIRGNEKHVERLSSLRSSAASGGRSRHKAGKRLDDGRFAPGTSLASSSQSPALLTPYSLLPAAPDLSPNGREGNADSDPRANPAALALQKFYLGKRPGSLMTGLPQDERVALDELIRITSNPQAVLEHYLADKREYYDKRKWPISLLVKNIHEHDGSTVEAAPKKRSFAHRTEDEQRAHEAELAEYIRQSEAEAVS